MKVYILVVIVCLTGLALGKSGECPDRHHHHHHHRHHDQNGTSIYPRPSPQPCMEDNECPGMEKCCEMERHKICVPPKRQDSHEEHHSEENQGMHDDDEEDCDDESREEEDDMSDHSGERKSKKCHRKHGHHKKGLIMICAAVGLTLIVIATVVFICVRRRNLRQQGHKHGLKNAVCVVNDDQKKNMDMNVTPVFTSAMYMTTQPPPYERLVDEEKKKEIV